MNKGFNIIEEVKKISQSGAPVLFVLLASKDCGDTRSFLPALDGAEKILGDKLQVIRFEGSHKDRESNTDNLKAALEHFKYDKTPGDAGGNQRGHFPSGAVYMNGEEVYRLPSDSVLSKISTEELVKNISEKMGQSPKLLVQSISPRPKFVGGKMPDWACHVERDEWNR